MPDEIQAANAGQPAVESAPTNPEPQAPAAPVETPAAPEATQETPAKQVPLENLIDERTRRKQADEYVKQLENRLGIQKNGPEAPVTPKPLESPAPQAPAKGAQDEYVEVDPRSFLTRDELDFHLRERDGWSSARSQYADEIKEFPALERMAEGVRQQTILTEGKFLSPGEAMSQIVKDLNLARKQGQTAAQVSTTIQQQSATVGSGTRVDPAAAEVAGLKSDLGSKDRKVRDGALRELLKRGVI